ncbi:MAG: hypothetical protein WBA93_24950 [Microcoleaceae cyanobacterium]
MEIKTVSVGGTFPGEFPSSNIIIELVATIFPDDDIEEVTDELKLQVAKLAGGGNPKKTKDALKTLRHPHLRDLRKDLIVELNDLEADIAKLGNKITARRTQLYALAGLAEKLNELEQVCDFYGIASEFWKSATAIMAKKGEPRPAISSATEPADDSDDDKVIPY